MNDRLISELQIVRALQGERKFMSNYRFLVPYIADLLEEFEDRSANNTSKNRFSWVFKKLASYFTKDELRFLKQWVRIVLPQSKFYFEMKRSLDKLGLIWVIKPGKNGGFEFELIKKEENGEQ